MAAFPPVTNTSVTKTLPSYLYVQYNDDENLIAFVDGYNGMTQTYLDWYNTASLPIYTLLSGSLLDWVAEGLYGIMRPVFATVGTALTGPYNSDELNAEEYNIGTSGTASSFYSADDDTFKRCITWHFYKGDGRTFTLKWLKRRCLRFLKGTNGADLNVTDSQQLSITISGYAVTIDASAVTGVSTAILQSFQYAIEGGILELPPQFTYAVTL